MRAADVYLEHELVLGDPLDWLQQIGIQREFVVQLLLTFLLSKTGNVFFLFTAMVKLKNLYQHNDVKDSNNDSASVYCDALSTTSQ